ncbi:hypothetical protein TruAng_008446 [Truncatella angustata]|nr:hypothetical protein TruAng_008446 [Truncatella angustata]
MPEQKGLFTIVKRCTQPQKVRLVEERILARILLVDLARHMGEGGGSVDECAKVGRLGPGRRQSGFSVAATSGSEVDDDAYSVTP